MCFALGTPACYLAPPPSPFWTQDNYRPAYVRIARNVLRDVASEFQAFQYFYVRAARPLHRRSQ